jgi:hypothetical protein
MERVHVRQETDYANLDKKGEAFWYFDDCNYPDANGRKEVVFRCPNGHGAACTNHSIEPNGEINASVLCWENDYHEWCILDGWPSDMRKRAGEHFPEKI